MYINMYIIIMYINPMPMHNLSIYFCLFIDMKGNIFHDDEGTWRNGFTPPPDVSLVSRCMSNAC